MTNRREERKRRSEEAKALKDRVRRQRTLGRWLMVAVGVLAVAVAAYATVKREAPAGKVWSPEHGHFHDR